MCSTPNGLEYLINTLIKNSLEDQARIGSRNLWNQTIDQLKNLLKRNKSIA